MSADLAAQQLLAVAGSALVLTQSSLTASLREWLSAEKRSRAIRGAGKLVSCPMCCGFWLGLFWAFLAGDRGLSLAFHGFAGSYVSAIAVALWLLVIEIHAALGLWRFLRTPKEAHDSSHAT